MQRNELETGELSRRDFLKLALPAFLNLTNIPGQGLLNGETNPEFQDQTIDSISLINRGKYLHIPETEGIGALEQVNFDWENYHRIDVKTPGISQGVSTLFGVNAVSRGQFLIRTDEIRRKLSNSQRLTRSEMLLLSIRNFYDNTIAESIFDLNSIDYAQAFNQVLNNFEIDGVVALKSGEDFGDVGKISVYNHVLERWVGPYNVIVLNTAEPTTFWRNSEVTSMYWGTSTQLAWLGDVSSEILQSSGLSLDPDHRTATAVRWYRDEISSLVDQDLDRIAIPEIQKVNLDSINEISRHFAINFRNLLATGNSQQIQNLFVQLQNNPELTFTPEFVNIGAYPQIANDFFIAYLLNGIGVPIFADNGSSATIDMITNPENQSTIGFPLSSGSIFHLIQNFYQNLTLERAIYTPIYPENNFGSIQNGVFVVEDVRNPYSYSGVVNLLEGVMITIDNEKRFLLKDLNGIFQNLSLDELSALYLDQPTYRLSVYY